LLPLDSSPEPPSFRTSLSMPDTLSMPPLPSSPPLQARALSLTFSGTGAEYFRIWIVNLLLTIVTLGIYSAWAKVRRLQYFDRNTALDGAAFDFHGEPVAILKGRIVAVVLVAAYQTAFGFSLVAGLAVFGVLLLVLPYLLRGALRFRLRNTSWRGLPFAFTGTTGGAYATFVPPMLLFMAPALLAAMVARNGPQPPSPWFALFFLLYLAWPTLHAAVKRYQHAHVRFGGADSTYTLKLVRFWPPYLMAFAIMFGIGVALAVIVGVTVKLVPKGGVGMLLTFVPLTLGYLGFLAIFPFLQGRLGNLVWSHTSFPGVTIASDMTFGGLLKLHAVNGLLTVLTLGLFRPFAAVRAHRYVLAHLHVSASIDIDALLDAGEHDRVNAVGDGAADFAGFDVSL
jgi:uncharacterized membrane protein YjgN (DUF898 family)